MKRRGPVQDANWLAWWLHFIGGLILGFVVGGFFALPRRGFPNGMIDPAYIPHFLAGGALVGGAICSYFRDRLLSNFDHVIPSDAPIHTDISRICSLSTGLIGLALVGYAVVGTLR